VAQALPDFSQGGKDAVRKKTDGGRGQHAPVKSPTAHGLEHLMPGEPAIAVAQQIGTILIVPPAALSASAGLTGRASCLGTLLTYFGN